MLLLLPLLAEAQVMFECTPKLENPYGICSHISRRGSDFEVREMDLQTMNELGIGCVRWDLDQTTICDLEATKFTPQDIDTTIMACQKYGVTPLPIIFRGGWDDMQFSNPEAYQQYVRYLSWRYRGQLDYWEVMNEPNLSPAIDKRKSGMEYAKVLKRVYNQLHYDNPNCQVLFSGLGGLHDSFLDGACAEEAYKYMDIMNFHTYEAPEALPNSFRILRSTMDKYGWNKPVWITETGLSTYPGASNSRKALYGSILTEVMSRLGMKRSKTRIAVLSAPEMQVLGLSEEELSMLKDFREVRIISAEELQNIDLQRYQMLIPSTGEYIPESCKEVVYNYVKHGGTLLCPSGVPFYYAVKEDGSPSTEGMEEYRKRLHITMKYWWVDYNGVKVPEVPSWYRMADWMQTDFAYKFDKGLSARYLAEDNLQKGDKMTPIAFAGDDNYTGVVAAIYQLDSDLKGNIIVQTQKGFEQNSEKEQAKRLPRAYLISFSYGIDKVFWYHLRAFEYSDTDPEAHFGILHKDFSEKPAAVAYKTLVTMCPDGSVRPKLTIKDNVYRADWQRPDGKHVAAWWTTSQPKDIKLDVKPVEVVDYMGSKVKPKGGKIRIDSGITYVVW